MLFAYLGYKSPPQLTQISSVKDTAFSLNAVDKQRTNLKHSETKQEKARKRAMIQFKLKNGCVKPDLKKIAATKAAESNYKIIINNP